MRTDLFLDTAAKAGYNDDDAFHGMGTEASRVHPGDVKHLDNRNVCSAPKEHNDMTNTVNFTMPWLSGNGQSIRVTKLDGSGSEIISGREPEDFALGVYNYMGGFTPAHDVPNFRDYTEEWFSLYQIPKISSRWARESHLLLTKHLYPFFGDMRLNEISRDDVQRFFNSKAGYSQSSVKHMKNLLNQVVSSAVEDGLLRDNVMNSKRLSFSRKETVREPIALDEVADIVSHLSRLTEEQQRMVAIPLFTGMRRGEFIALQWRHVDMAARMIHVVQAASFTDNTPDLKEPKSKAGYRLIPIIDDLLPYLANRGKPEEYVLGGKTRPLTKRAYEWRWKRIAGIIDLHGATAHVLRHTFATMAVENIDIKTMQTILGHSKADITINRYEHPPQRLLENAAHQLTGLYTGAQKQPPVDETGDCDGNPSHRVSG